jgi:tetratricopeptide (TPR) repeat protein
MNACRHHSLTCGLFLLLSTVPLVCAQAVAPPDSTGSASAESSDLAPTKIRQALAAERQAIAIHPKDPSNYINLAYTLTDAGIVDQARQVVAKAVSLQPSSALAYSAQGWVLHHNLIGVDYGRGFDYEASLASYKKAVELDPNDLALRQSLAELLEYDKNGIRYAPDSHLAETIEIYRYIRAHQPAPTTEVEDNFIIECFYAGMYEEVLAEIAKVPESPVRDGVAVAALAATRGTQVAIDFANQIGGDEQKKKDALSYAAEGLWNMRLYPQAADLLTASLADTSGSREVMGKIQIFHNLKPYHGTDIPPTDPRSPVHRLIVAEILDTLTEEVISQCVSRHAFASEADWRLSLAKADSITGKMRTLSRQTGLPQVVIEDILFGSIKITVLPSAEPGARVLLQIAGTAPRNFFVLQEEGTYKIVASNRGSNEVGTEVLYLLSQHRVPEAEALLNWKRSLVQKETGDDPLGGLLFARLWVVGRSSGVQEIKLAAASLLSDRSMLQALLPSAVAARKSASTETERDNLDLLLASLYLDTQDGPDAEVIARHLLQRQPDSDTAVNLVGRAYGLEKKWAAWRSLLDARLQKHPDNRGLLVQSASEAEAEGDFARARRNYRSILDSGRASVEDNNMYAWLSLFNDSADEQALAAAQQANLLTQQNNFNSLHTLACLDAAVGRTAEARQLLLQAMSVAGLEEPDSSIWYGFGRIYEQYGLNDAAIGAYRRVEMPAGNLDPADTFVLAQSRLAALRAK